MPPCLSCVCVPYYDLSVCRIRFTLIWAVAVVEVGERATPLPTACRILPPSAHNAGRGRGELSLQKELSVSVLCQSYIWPMSALASDAAFMSSFAAPAAPSAKLPSKDYMRRARMQDGESAAGCDAGAASSSASAPPGGLVREYTVWPSKNKFCCWGFCMTGPEEDVGPNSCAWLTVLSPMALFFYVWGETLAQTSGMLLGVVLLCFASTIFWFLVTSFTDPGILARNSDPLARSQPTPPLFRQRVDEDGVTVTDTWCSTCLIYRPPRASHCPDCDNCVRDFDHHCPFTRNCIGARNYPFFLNFLISVSLSLAALLFSCLLLSGGMTRTIAASREPELVGLVNLVLVLFSVVLSLLMWGFTGYHISLVCSGQTTKEHLRGRKNGARRLLICERLECCRMAPSEVHPRRLVPASSRAVVVTGRGVPIISHHQL